VVCSADINCWYQKTALGLLEDGGANAAVDSHTDDDVAVVEHK